MAANLLLPGRIAVVTGGASGIGRAVCSVFAREGAKVAVVDVNKEKAEETLSLLSHGSGHKAYTVNTSSSTEIANLMNQVKEHFQGVPCAVVNAAGITRDNFMIKMEEDQFDEVISVNLKGTFLINQAVGKAMVAEKVKNGSIVNISSISGRIGNIGQTNYAASKAGVIGMTKAIAKELSRFNIRVNCVLPGFIETPMTDAVPDKVKQMAVMLTPLQRMGTPEEIAEVCAFLASTRSSYITGEAIEVTGGFGM